MGAIIEQHADPDAFSAAICDALSEYERSTETIRAMVEGRLGKVTLRANVISELEALEADGFVIRSPVKWIRPTDRSETPFHVWRWAQETGRAA